MALQPIAMGTNRGATGAGGGKFIGCSSCPSLPLSIQLVAAPLRSGILEPGMLPAGQGWSPASMQGTQVQLDAEHVPLDASARLMPARIWSLQVRCSSIAAPLTVRALWCTGSGGQAPLQPPAQRAHALPHPPLSLAPGRSSMAIAMHRSALALSALLLAALLAAVPAAATAAKPVALSLLGSAAFPAAEQVGCGREIDTGACACTGWGRGHAACDAVAKSRCAGRRPTTTIRYSPPALLLSCRSRLTTSRRSPTSSAAPPWGCAEAVPCHACVDASSAGRGGRGVAQHACNHS